MVMRWAHNRVNGVSITSGPIMKQEIRPTPTLKGKSAKRFLAEINDKEISKEQQKFLDECEKLVDANVA